MKGQSIGQLNQGRNNTFDFLRFLLASMVIFSHSFAMLYNNTPHAFDPLLRGTRGQEAIGGIAVDGFFLISGFLITMSWEHCKSALDYAKRRSLRIMPGLIAVLAVTVFIIGPLTTTLPLHSYFCSPRTYAYFAMMGTVNLHLTDRLPGVFASNPFTWRVNGSLWTIRCEVICYIFVAVLGLTGGLRRPLLVPLATAAGIVIFALNGRHGETVGDFTDSLRVLTYFLCGMSFYLYRDRIPHSPSLFFASLAGIVISEMFGVLACTLPILGAYALFYVAFKPVFGLQNFARCGDFSYGLYLYAFPIEQALVSRFPNAWSIATVFFATFAVALACAILSWKFVERPCLQLKRKTIRPTDRPMQPAKLSMVASLQQAERAGEKS